MRARLEAERRLCGNTAISVKEITNGPVKCYDRELACLVLDPRTSHNVLKHWTRPDRVNAAKKLREIFVDFLLSIEKRAGPDLESNKSKNASLDFWANEDDAQNNNDFCITIEEWEKNRRQQLEEDFVYLLKNYVDYVKKFD